MSDEILLNEAAYAVWQTVKERGPIELGEVVKLTGVDQAQVSAAATEAAKSEYFSIELRRLEMVYCPVVRWRVRHTDTIDEHWRSNVGQCGGLLEQIFPRRLGRYNRRSCRA